MAIEWPAWAHRRAEGWRVRTAGQHDEPKVRILEPSRRRHPSRRSRRPWGDLTWSWNCCHAARACARASALGRRDATKGATAARARWISRGVRSHDTPRRCCGKETGSRVRRGVIHASTHSRCPHPIAGTRQEAFALIGFSTRRENQPPPRIPFRGCRGVTHGRTRRCPQLTSLPPPTASSSCTARASQIRPPYFRVRTQTRGRARPSAAERGQLVLLRMDCNELPSRAYSM